MNGKHQTIEYNQKKIKQNEKKKKQTRGINGKRNLQKGTIVVKNNTTQ